MKTLFLFISMALVTISSELYAQCEPLTPDQCPDPENNGEVCPDTLEPAFLNQYYSQVATIKPPQVYYLGPDSTEINLHHVKLMEVDNLPDGINWQSNSPDSVFNAGEYYCVLMEGTPDSAGDFALRIIVDVYVLVFNTPVYVATVTDSTSLTLQVVDDSGIPGYENPALRADQNIPNPFLTETRISYYSEIAGSVLFEVFSFMGEKMHSEEFYSQRGVNVITYDGRTLSPGTYFYRLRTEKYRTGGIMIRSAN